MYPELILYCERELVALFGQKEQVNPMTVQVFGGWSDARMVRRYVRQLDVSNSDFADKMYQA